ncbi:hypothetical protein HU230_0007965 [Bradyrhizobium quebecense]|uniref:Uncharacterized protein n=1 Tax=Bradyrhizobium quebecense TaxID=2748629 RepID=A0A973WPN7_9BRAD|nr:hypothetical protein [Bradyrhizobium quebecense]UGA45962.1 hypothetical protein HU230_0007965 [Bradyrhizobium quebecense]
MASRKNSVSKPQSNAASEAAGAKPAAMAGSNQPVIDQGGAATGATDTGPQQPGADQVKPKRGRAASELRSFEVKSLLKHDGGTYEVGDEVELSHAAFLPLKASGVVGGDWPEG